MSSHTSLGGLKRKISARLGVGLAGCAAVERAGVGTAPTTPPLALQYSLIKAESGNLDPEFALALSASLGLSVFIETGTYRGDTVWPLRGGFESIITVELDKALANAAELRFAGSPNVTVLRGDSSSTLTEALRLCGKRPALIWLDAHFSGIGTAYGDGNTPVHQELDLIFKSGRSRDVILIDDLRCFRPQPSAFDTHESLEGYPPATEIAGRLRARGYQVLVMCDALIAIPASVSARVTASPVLQACTSLKLDAFAPEARAALEAVVGSAAGAERWALTAIPDFIQLGTRYGLGGDYFYWRSLLRPPENDAQATADKDYARRCGIPVAP